MSEAEVIQTINESSWRSAKAGRFESRIRMKVKYDLEADALYIEIKGTTVTTKRLDQDIAIDYDSEGQIAGIEILSAKERVLGGKKPANGCNLVLNLVQYSSVRKEVALKCPLASSQ